ncbi:MAG TPA: hypothetical protein VD814_02700 [Nocardioides sp.]|nr:hypothetical protein [Nocardioides sp.]
MRDLVRAVVVAVPLGLGASLVLADSPEPLFRFADRQIVESSGLALRDGLVLTVNDSGDTARVFAVDPEDGRTVGVTRWAGEPVDVEALAPAGPGEVWVGDIGDNDRDRSSIRVLRVPVGPGERTAAGAGLDLVYPDGPNDAEALLCHPRTGRLLVVTKDVFGGQVYAVRPRPDEERQRLLRIGEAMPLVTDGAFFPDGRHLVLRDYSKAVVLSYPELEVVGEVTLPPARQGEGVAVTPEGTLLVSSEGVRSAVHEVALPAEVQRALAGEPAASPTASGSPTPTAAPAPTTSGDAAPGAGAATGRDPWPWVVGGIVGLAMVVVLVRSLRPR